MGGGVDVSKARSKGMVLSVILSLECIVEFPRTFNQITRERCQVQASLGCQMLDFKSKTHLGFTVARTHQGMIKRGSSLIIRSPTSISLIATTPIPEI